ncbi:hypothetical protein [Phenylobacterium deserti]|uniref:Uncharacterized protein n=1 Tax=Phenylobacterium deserti TaxID=1914756 RepID=A0A328AC48_9CAUL|nr:hypothetical protein [Phenylobacterium deserti]RAK50934.1 hypothetical protein DJ018_17365 [Phenylobacterium deserti]
MLAPLLALVLAFAQPALSEKDLGQEAAPAPLFSAEQVERLIARSARAITHRTGKIRGQALGRFDTPLGEAEAFRTDFLQNQFRRRYVLLIHPREISNGPVTITLTSNLQVDKLARQNGDAPPLFLDLYTCKRHVTLTMLAQEPSFEELRSLVVARLQDGSAPSSTQAPAGPSCNFAPYVLPGLEFGG